MPIKSKAQRRKFAELLLKGEITPETFEEWNRAAGDAELPERIHPKKAAKRKRKVATKRKPARKPARKPVRKRAAKGRPTPKRAAKRKPARKRAKRGAS